MNDERRRILNMLAEGKITAGEAERLLDALAHPAPSAAIERPVRGSESGPKYLRVQVDPKQSGRDQVNIKVPLSLIRTGMKLGAMMPSGVKERINGALADKGVNIDLTRMDNQDFETLVEALSETSIEVDDAKEHVRIYCE